MSENVIQTSFSSGELAPSIFARTDIAKYHSGAALMRNFFVDYRSGASTRTGTQFIIQAFISSSRVRLIPFQFSTGVTYVLEFGNQYIRFISNGASVLETPFNVTGASNANPAVITVPGNNFATGDWVFVSGINGAVQYNGRYYRVQVGGANLTLSDVNGNLINSLAYGAYINGGTVARVYKLASPYISADLELLKFIQSASVMTLTHPNYPPMNLSLVTPTNWTLVPVSFATTILPPTGLTASASSAGSTNYSYVVTSQDASGQESAPSTPVALAAAVNVGATAGTITISWAAAVGAAFYNVYKAEISITNPVVAGAAYGFIGQCSGTSFQDSNIVPDFSTTPPILKNPFAGGNNPGCACYFDQRLFYAASISGPTTFWGSQPGFFNNFNITEPIQDDDSITGTIVSTQLNAIKNMIPMPGGLITLTSKGAWQINGGSGSITTVAITPANATATPQAYNGASDVPPIVVNFDVIYVQAKGSIVRDLTYNIYANIYTGTDISLLANHLFFGHQITEWAYAEEPFKLVHAVRDDGVLLTLTFVKEQEIFGWSHHDTLGLYQSVCSVTEGQVDAVYVVVQRLIGGQYVQYIERFADRTFLYGAEDAWNVDCGIRSALPAPSANLTASASFGTGVTFSTDAPVFSSASVGQILRIGGGIATITTFVSPTQIIGNLTQPITLLLPNDPNRIPLPATPGNWSIATPTTVFGGLDYINGQTVSILADGGVIAPQVVTNNQITLPQPATKVVVGLKFLPQLQTMYLDVGEPTIQGKRKKINDLTVRVTDSRGLKAGRTFQTLIPMKELNRLIPMGNPIPLITGDERIVMDPLWDVPGQICFQLDDPLPATILGVIPEITVGDTK